MKLTVHSADSDPHQYFDTVLVCPRLNSVRRAENRRHRGVTLAEDSERR
jgi:hypothetical protein